MQKTVIMNMRRLLFLVLAFLCAGMLFAQVPQAFHYQMVVRDANDVLVRSRSIGLQLTIQRNNSGSPVILYQETQSATTDVNGLLKIEVGTGTRNTTYGEFTAIQWGTYNDIELKSDVDLNGGTSYTLSATQPLQAVPYAFMAAEHQDLANAVLKGNLAGGEQLKSVKDPTDPQDVVTKRYLDSVVAELVRRGNSLSRDTAACINAGSLAWRGNSYSVAGTYTYTKAGAGAGGLDSVIILTLTIGPGTHNVETVNQAGSYTWHGNNYAASGTYTYAYTDGNGCPSVDTLKLTISASVVYGDTAAVECGGFTWYGTPLLASGNYTHTFTGGGPGGVDSILRLALTIKPLGLNVINHTDCDSYHWAVDGNDYDASGTYSVTYNGGTPNGAANGCDSVVRLNLTINNTVYRDTAADKCEHFTWYGNDYTSTSNPTKTFSGGATNGCDRTIRLALTIRPKATGTDTRSACETYDWIDGNTYTVSNNTATYTFTEGAVNGCDSTVTLNLTIKHNTSFTDIRTECDSYTWIDGNTYNASNNTAVHHTTNVAGCDSAVTLNLTLNQSTSAIDQQVACDSYTWINGTTYNSSTTTPTHTIPNAAGCDSTITLHLTIKAGTKSNETVNVCGSIATWNGETYNATTSGKSYDVYSVNGDGCPDTTHLTVYNRAYTGAGLSFDTVCAGTTSYTWGDWNDESTTLQNVTVYSEDFEGLGTGASPTGGWWGERTATTMTGFKAYSTFGSYVPSAQHGSKFLINVGTDNSNYQAAGIYSPGFTTTGGQVTVSFYYRQNATAYYPYMYVWVTNSQSDDWSEGSYVRSIFNNSSALQSSWTQSTTTFTPSAGTYYLMFYCEQANLGYLAIDNIVVTERRNVTTYTPHVTDLSSTPNGSNWTSGITTNAYGCPTSGRYIHKRAAGEGYNEVACDSYRWINGTNYTEDQTNRLYSHTRTYNTHSCNVTDTLNLTINNPASSATTQTATNNYTWATSGVDGHGTGFTYNYSGNYIGPFYATGVCQSRDTLHLTVNRIACAGSKYTISSCTPFTWAASGAYGKGTSSTYSTVGTNQYVGPEYTPAGCAVAIHDTIVLTYGTAASTRYDVAECDNYTWPASGVNGHGTTTTYSTLGNHRYTGPTYYTAVGCLSVDTLNLTLNASTHSEETQTVCDSVDWNGSWRKTTGDHEAHFTNVAGCDSTRTLHLTVNQTKHFDTAITVCAGVTSVPTQRIVQLYYEDFENASVLDDWEFGIGTGAQYALDGWQRVSGSKAYNGYSLVCESPQNHSYVWASSYANTPLIYLEDPARTSISFKLKLPAVWNWNDDYLPDLFQLYALQENDEDVLDNYDEKVIFDNKNGSSRLQASSWITRTVSLATFYTAPGNYYFVFRDRDAWSYAAIDSVDVRGPASIAVPNDLPLGTTTRTTTYTAANGCDSIVRITWTVNSCGGHIDLNIDPSFASPIRENHPTPEYIECETQHGDCATEQHEEFENNTSNDYDYSNHSETTDMSKDSDHSEPSEVPDNSESYQADRPKAIRTRMAF